MRLFYRKMIEKFAPNFFPPHNDATRVYTLIQTDCLEVSEMNYYYFFFFFTLHANSVPSSGYNSFSNILSHNNLCSVASYTLRSK